MVPASKTLSFLALMLALASSSPASAQDKALPPAFQKTFSGAVTNASFPLIAGMQAGQLGMGYVIDGVPRLKSSALEFHGILKDCLDLLTKKFDYQWEIGPHNVLIFTKAFKDPLDRPEVSLADFKYFTNFILT